MVFSLDVFIILQVSLTRADRKLRPRSESRVRGALCRVMILLIRREAMRCASQEGKPNASDATQNDSSTIQTAC